MKAIDAQPIKKIAEAKARKKKKVINFLILFCCNYMNCTTKYYQR